MTAVEVYATWERYAERRLTIALAHHPVNFLLNNGIRGLKNILVGLASVLVRGDGRYFDFRSTSDLIDRAKRLVGASQNPFAVLTTDQRNYLDTLGAIRNYTVHQSETAFASYKRFLSEVCGVNAKPQPDEFLNAIDYRASSPLRGRPRIMGLIAVVEQVIAIT
jgi:hypothetical protein